MNIDRDQIWTAVLEPYFLNSDIGFSKSIVKYLNGLYTKRVELDPGATLLHPVLKRNGDGIIFLCLPDQTPEVWDHYFGEVCTEWRKKYDRSELVDAAVVGQQNIDLYRRKYNYSKLVNYDPAQHMFSTWQYGWTPEQDLEYFKFWYGSDPTNGFPQRPNGWDEIFNLSNLNLFARISTGLSQFLSGNQPINGRYSKLYQYWQKLIELLDQEIFSPKSFLGPGDLADAKISLARLLYSCRQEAYTVELFDRKSTKENVNSLPSHPTELAGLSGAEIWEIGEVQSMRSKILSDIESGVFSESIVALDRWAQYPNIDIDASLVVPTTKEQVKYKDPWEIPKCNVPLQDLEIK